MWNRIENKLEQPFQFEQTVFLFRRVLYCLLLCYTLFSLPFHEELWGEHSMSHSFGVSRFITDQFIHLLYFPFIAKYHLGFVLIQVILLLYVISGKDKLWIRWGIWLLTVNLLNRPYLAQTGGDQLLVLLFFYVNFISMPVLLSTFTKNLLNYFFYFSVVGQILFLYVSSVAFKLYGEEWLNGTAIFQVIQVDGYSHPLLQKMFDGQYWVLIVLSYVTLIYQVLFPVLVFTKRWGKIILLIGIGFHLFISFGMGLFFFGLTMIVSYLLFVSNDKAEKFLNKKKRLLFRKASSNIS